MKYIHKITGFLLFGLYPLLASSQVVINEIQTSNTKTITNQFFEYDDWIEIYNSGSSSVNMLNYGLSDDSLQPYKFRFPDYNLAPGAFLTVFAADTNISNLTHWETAVKASDTWKYRANTSAVSGNWRDPAFNDAGWSSGTGGIGMGDSDDGTTISGVVSVYMRKSFTISDTSKIFEAVLNMDYDDGFVAYLNGVEIARVNLGIRGVVPAWNALAPLSREAVLYQGDYPDSTHIDFNTLRGIIKNGTNVLAIETHNTSGTYTDMSSNPYLTFAVKDGSSFFPAPPSWFHRAPVNYLHADFKISKSGETIFLYNAGSVLLDKKSTGYLESGNSIARNPNGSSSWCLSDVPTPSASNNGSPCKTAYATNPIFSLQGGFYSGTRTLTLSTSYPGGSIRYTTDGSDVTASSSLYSTPISIPSTRTIRARVFATNAIASPIVTHSYFINLTCRLPIVSLTTDPVNLYDYNTGIFVDGPGAEPANPHFGANYWLDMEKDVTFEYYERDKSLQFKFNAGLCVTGGWSRAGGQKSLEFKLGDKYGLSSLNYSLQSAKPWNDKWDNFILHSSGNDRAICHMRDALMNRVLKGTFNNYIAYEPTLVFLNGANWGIYYFRENDDHHWIENNFGYKSDEVDLLKESYFYPGIEVKRGSDEAFFSMYNYAVNTSPTDTGYYRRMSEMMNLENMTDYFIAETYYPNDDWMGGSNNNLKLWRPRKPDGKFSYIIYDLEFGLGYSGSANKNMLNTALNASPHNYNSDLFVALTNNPTFKRYFINRYADLINTTFLPSNIQSVAYMFRDSIKYDYNLQFSKWGGADSATWINNIATMMTFASQRPAYARNFVQSEFGMNGQVTLTLNVSPAGAGVIQISTVTPENYPWTGVYFNGNPVTLTAIPNPGFTFDHWSGSTPGSNNTNQNITYNFTSSQTITCHFTGSASPALIAFSELNYHSDSLHESGDWIELHNRGTQSIDISKWNFRDEADNHVYTIPAGTTIAANGYLVLASDLTMFRSVHPSVTNVIGDFGFDFSNNGEELRLYNRSDVLYTSFTYSDQLPFPVSTDAGGYTLERLNETVSADDGNNWFAGCLRGSPGRAYSLPVSSITPPASNFICPGSTLTLIATAGSGNSYQWLKNNVAISGATSSTYTVNSAGNYAIQVSSNGCSSVSSAVSIAASVAEQVNSTSPGTRCGAGSVTLNATSTSTLNWYADSTSSTVLGTGNNFITPSISQSTNYFVQAVGNCPGTRIRVRATVNAVTASPVATDNFRCGPGTVNLSASDTAIVNWYDAASGGNLVHTGYNFTTPGISQNTNYYLSAGTICPSPRVIIRATITEVCAAPVVSNGTRCGNGSVVLSATDTAQVRWYDSASGGTLLFTGSTFNTPSISATTIYYAEAGSVCPSARVAGTATIETVSAPPVIADESRCGSGTLTFSSSSSSTAWFTVATGGSPAGTGNSFTTPVINSNTVFYAQSGIACPSQRISFNANVLPVSAPPSVVSADRCGTGSVTLSASGNADLNWYTAASGGILVNTGANFTTPVINQSTTYYVEAGSVCPSSRVAVDAIVKTITPDPVAVDVMRCGTGDVTINASSSSVINWYDSPGGNLLSTGNSLTISQLTATTTYYLQAGIDCPSAIVDVTAQIVAVAADPVITNGSHCGAGAVTLNASSPEALNWFDAVNGNLLGSGASFTTPLISTTTTFYVQAGDDCPGNFVPVIAAINPLPADPQVTDGSLCGIGSVSLSASGSGDIHWYDAPNGTLLFTGNAFNTPLISQSAIYYVQVDDGCAGNFVPVNATILSVPADPQITNASVCSAGSMTLVANGPGSISWYDAINGNILSAGSTYVTPVINQTTIYYVQVVDGGCAGNFVPAEATVIPVSTVTSTGNGQSCGSGIVTLSANSTDPIEWYDAPNGTLLFSGNNFTTPILSSSVTYYAVANGICPSAPVAVMANIYAEPVVYLGADTAIETGQVLVLDAGNGFASYQWSTSEITSSISVISSNEYSVVVTDANGCTATDEISVSVIAGMFEKELAGISVYPNPIVSSATLTLPIHSGNITINLFSEEGKLIFSRVQNANISSSEIEMEKYASGVYYLKIQNSNAVKVLKVIKK